MAYSIEEVNDLGYEEFLEVFGNVVEHCGLCAAAIWAHRPFYNVHAIHTELCNFIDNLPSIGQEGILRLHPDLAGRTATSLRNAQLPVKDDVSIPEAMEKQDNFKEQHGKQGVLTQESSAEQLAAGLDTLTDDETETLRDLNNRYKIKFGFPFVICARENKKQAILNGLSTRIEHPSSEVEVKIGIAEVKKIMLHRLLALVRSEN